MGSTRCLCICRSLPLYQQNPTTMRATVACQFGSTSNMRKQQIKQQKVNYLSALPMLSDAILVVRFIVYIAT